MVKWKEGPTGARGSLLDRYVRPGGNDKVRWRSFWSYVISIAVHLALLFVLSRTVGPIPGRVTTSAASTVRTVAVVPLEGDDLRFAASSLALARGRGETFAGPEVALDAAARPRKPVEPDLRATRPSPASPPRGPVPTVADDPQPTRPREPARAQPAATAPSLPAPSRDEPSLGREVPEPSTLPIMEVQSPSSRQLERPKLEVSASSRQQERLSLEPSAPTGVAPSSEPTRSASPVAPSVPVTAESVSGARLHDGQPLIGQSSVGQSSIGQPSIAVEPMTGVEPGAESPASQRALLQDPVRAVAESPAVVTDMSRPVDASRLPVAAAEAGSVRPEPEGLTPVAAGAPVMEIRDRFSPVAADVEPTEGQRTYRDPSPVPAAAPAFSQRPLRTVGPPDSDGLVVTEGESSDRLREDPLRQASGSEPTVLEVAGVPDDKARLTPQPRLIVYPEELRDVHWDGPVLVRVWPDEEGKVSRWEVDRPRGDDRIAAALEGVIHQWRFAVHPAWSLAGRPPPAVVVRLDPPQSE